MFAFTTMGHHHHHSHDHHHQSMGNIRVAFWLNTGFAILELVGGFYTNSMAIISDALHDFGDSLSLGFAYYFEKKSGKSRDEDFTYGYKRFSLLGAFLNSMVLIIGSLFIIREAISRILHPQEVHVPGMFVLAIIGVAVNTYAMLRLRRGTSVNERVVSLHFLEDVLGWVAVLIGSIVMMVTDVPVLDPILSVLIAVFILFNVYKNLRHAFRIVLQGIPENMDMKGIQKAVMEVKGVVDVHDLHSWTMDGRYNVMTMHVVLGRVTTLEEVERIKMEIRILLKGLNVQHATIETEWEGNGCEAIKVNAID